MKESEAIPIPKNDFLISVNTHSDVSAGFISLLCRKVSDKETQLLNLAYHSVRKRTDDALLKVGPLADNCERSAFHLNTCQRLSASESVIRVLSDFKDEGHIEIEGGKIKVLLRPGGCYRSFGHQILSAIAG